MEFKAAATTTGIRKRKRSGANEMDEQPEVHVPALRFDLQSSTPWYTIFMFVIPLEVDVLQLHFYDSSSFKIHPINMWTFVFAVFIYCIALTYCIKNWLTGSRSYDNICDKIGYISGFLASAAFISMLIKSPFGLLIFVIWLVISIMFVNFARKWILKLALKLYKSSKDAGHNILKSIIGTEGETTLHV